MLTVAIGALALLFLGLAYVNWFRPDLFRFESVAVTADPSVRHALDTHMAVLSDLPYAELAQLPESTQERSTIDDRDAVFDISRTLLPDGRVQVVVTVAVKQPVGLFWRPLLVAASGLRMDQAGVWLPIADAALTEFAMNADAEVFYGR